MIPAPLRTFAALALFAWPTVAQESAAPVAEAASIVARNAEGHHIILCGSGGEVEFSPKFREWGTRLKSALSSKLGVPSAHISILTEPETDAPPTGTATSFESIQSLFESLAQSVSADDDVFVYLIGHGSYLRDTSKFLIPGPDLSAEALDGMLAELPAQRAIVINGTSASAGFINVLSAPNRIVCAATKSVAEVNATEYMRFFIEALEDGSADRNRDERISVLEACEQAAALTASWYASETLIATEHSILDDNGDGLGTRLPIDPTLNEAPPDAPVSNVSKIDGALAGQVFLKDYSFPANAPKELIVAYLAALDEVKALRARKGTMAEADYYAQLEPLLLKAARANRDIRAHSSPTSEGTTSVQN